MSSLPVKGDIDRDFVEQPLRRAGRGQNGARAVDDGGVERGVGGIADQRGDEGHAGEFASREGKAVLIAGPTASGKSALALELAQKTGGVVINADSMQVYRDLRVITARPTLAEEARVPHRLYGHVDAAVNFSAGAWVADAAKVLAEARAQNRAADFRRRLRALFQGADARAVGGAADPAGDPRRRARAAGARRRRGAACRTGAARSGVGRAPEAARPHPHRPRAGSGGGDRPLADRLASRRPAAAVAAGRVLRAVSRARARRNSTRGSMRASMRCWRRRAGGGRGAWRRESSIRCCRR